MFTVVAILRECISASSDLFAHLDIVVYSATIAKSPLLKPFEERLAVSENLHDRLTHFSHCLETRLADTKICLDGLFFIRDKLNACLRDILADIRSGSRYPYLPTPAADANFKSFLSPGFKEFRDRLPSTTLEPLTLRLRQAHHGVDQLFNLAPTIFSRLQAPGSGSLSAGHKHLILPGLPASWSNSEPSTSINSTLDADSHTNYPYRTTVVAQERPQDLTEWDEELEKELLEQLQHCHLRHFGDTSTQADAHNYQQRTNPEERFLQPAEH
ncbi:hypothetical protein BDW74DRAFT_177692 [Aspergillus multicolor]|uniref:uncharacterized protein n=1 Tax=Aspergillus multicolor TaxID=41759 RepID=UPI003CCD083B